MRIERKTPKPVYTISPVHLDSLRSTHSQEMEIKTVDEGLVLL
jgi:hypothetical protein